jgi:hypothetical protein
MRHRNAMPTAYSAGAAFRISTGPSSPLTRLTT